MEIRERMKKALPFNGWQNLPLVSGFDQEGVQSLSKEVFPFEGCGGQSPLVAGIGLPLA